MSVPLCETAMLGLSILAGKHPAVAGVYMDSRDGEADCASIEALRNGGAATAVWGCAKKASDFLRAPTRSFEDEPGRGSAGFHAELLQDVLDMFFHGARREAEFAADVGI